MRSLNKKGLEIQERIFGFVEPYPVFDEKMIRKYFTKNKFRVKISIEIATEKDLDKIELLRNQLLIIDLNLNMERKEIFPLRKLNFRFSLLKNVQNLYLSHFDLSLLDKDLKQAM